MAVRYGAFTPARRAALKRAQLASAAKRRGTGKARFSQTTRRRVKRTAIAAGTVGAVAGAGVAYHKASGSKVIARVPRTPTVHHHVTGKPIGRTGFHHSGKSVGFTHRNKKGDKTILYAHGVNKKKLHGTKAKAGPSSPIKPHKFTMHQKQTLKRFNKASRGSEQYAREAMGVTHSTPSGYQNRKIEAGEAIRRTRNYMQYQQSKGRKVSAAHHMAASKFYQNQPRYTGGTVKPLKRKVSSGGRRRQNRFHTRKNMSYSAGPTVLGSRKRQPKAGA